MKGRMEVLNLKKPILAQDENLKNYIHNSFNITKKEPVVKKEYICEKLREANNKTIDGKQNEDNTGVKFFDSPVDMKQKLEIKYEDDIEEEDYDSEDDSYDHSLDQLQVRESNSSKQEINSINQENFIPYQADHSPIHSCFSGAYFESSVLNFQIGSLMEKHDSVRDKINAELSSNQINISETAEKTNDSILLSIVYATINVPFSQVSKFLTAYNISKSQLMVIRKVRRQVKNRLYAQNCRRRRVAHIKNLANELKHLRNEKKKLCIIREDLTSEMVNLEDRYKQLHNYVINALTEKHKFNDFQLTDNNMNVPDSSEEIRAQKRKLFEERELMETKKKKLENLFDQLHQHIFSVIETRHRTNGINCAVGGNFDFKLCNMDIVNELAMLKEYWSKNNAKNENIEFESSVSIDDSRTSENKLNDFVDYESSVSVDENQMEEKLNDDYFNSNEKTPNFHESENSLNADNSDSLACDNTNSVDYDRDLIFANRIDCNNYDEFTLTKNKNNFSDDNSENSLTIWSDYESDNEKDEMKETKNDRIEKQDPGIVSDDDDEENKTFDLIDIHSQNKDLQIKRDTIQNQYDQLYSYILQKLQISEIEFLKMFVDYCLYVLRTSNGKSNFVNFENS